MIDFPFLTDREHSSKHLREQLVVLFDPGLCAHLHRIPGTTHGRCVAENEGIQVINAHTMKHGGGKNINPFGRFPVPMANHLCLSLPLGTSFFQHTGPVSLGTVLLPGETGGHMTRALELMPHFPWSMNPSLKRAEPTPRLCNQDQPKAEVPDDSPRFPV